ncbi:MAG: carbohydrate-binding protein, partial [Tunicatimonas sp.]|uniref:carbohydrate-binding protein n=1 Tax=Tunicatimonas sp. TaxID=1940096 RepID=UPI003C77BD02
GVPGFIEAENFTQNLGTTSVGSSTASGGYYLGSIQKDDSVVYRINVPSAGSYNLIFRVANNSGNPTTITIRHENNINPVLLFVPVGSDWNDWIDPKPSTTLNLDAGPQNIWLKFSGGSSELMRIDWIEIE